MYKTLGFRWLFEVFCPASAFATADSDEARNPQRFIHVSVMHKQTNQIAMKIIINTFLLVLFLNSNMIQNCKNDVGKDKFTKLDSVIIENSEKRLYNYDNSGNNLQVLEQKWENQNWTYTTKYDNIFDKNRLLTSEIKSIYNNQTWVYVSKSIHNYDSEGNEILTELFFWGNSTWNKSLKFEFSLNSKSQRESELTYRWKDNKWEFDKKRTYKYDSNDKLINTTLFMWNKARWNPLDKTEYNYSSSGYETLLINFNWNDSIWGYDWKGETIYNKDNKKEQEIGFTWKSTDWVKAGKDLYKYDKVSLEHIHYILKDTAWFYHSKNVTTNDEKGNIINNKTLFWDKELLKWDIKYEERISVDTSIYTSNVAFPIKDGIYGFKNKLSKNIPRLIEILDWDGIDNKLKVTKKITFYYSKN